MPSNFPFQFPPNSFIPGEEQLPAAASFPSCDDDLLEMEFCSVQIGKICIESNATNLYCRVPVPSDQHTNYNYTRTGRGLLAVPSRRREDKPVLAAATDGWTGRNCG